MFFRFTLHVHRIYQPPGTWETALDNPKVHAKSSTVIRSFLTDHPISLLAIALWFSPPDYVLHLIVSAPRRPQTHVQ